jgi:hypothetical protein
MEHKVRDEINKIMFTCHFDRKNMKSSVKFYLQKPLKYEIKKKNDILIEKNKIFGTNLSSIIHKQCNNSS